MPVHTVKIDAKWAGGTATRFKAGKHEVIIDEPAALGGSDLGPTPVQYVLGAWAGCVAFIGRIVAKEMKITLDELEITAEGDINADGYMGRDKKIRAGFSEIRLKVNVKSSADRETLALWLKTVESRCPVADNLLNTTPSKVVLV